MATIQKNFSFPMELEVDFLYLKNHGENLSELLGKAIKAKADELRHQEGKQ